MSVCLFIDGPLDGERREVGDPPPPYFYCATTLPPLWLAEAPPDAPVPVLSHRYRRVSKVYYIYEGCET